MTTPFQAQGSSRGMAAALAVVAGLAPNGAAGAEGDPVRGKLVFARCLFCHSADPGVHKAGPSLASIWGRTAGSVEGFGKYSAALKASKIVWTAEALDRWLRGPRAFVPGTGMIDVRLRNAVDRADLIAYLESLASTAANEAKAPSEKERQ